MQWSQYDEISVHPSFCLFVSWISYHHLNKHFPFSWRQSVTQLPVLLSRVLVISPLLADSCVFGCSCGGGEGGLFAYPGRTPLLILCSVGPSGQGVQMTHSFLVTARVPYTKEILDGRTSTVYLPVQTVWRDPALRLRAWLHCSCSQAALMLMLTLGQPLKN